MGITIRVATENDIPAVISLIHEFAAFEELSDFCEVDKSRLSIAMFGAGGFVQGLIAEDGERPVGYALYFRNFSSFRGQRGFYLDDIYVTEAYRGQGVGEMMLRKIARHATSEGLERIDFLVLDWNTPAAGFYRKLGAIHDPEERHYKFTDDAFRRLASDKDS